MIKNKDIIFYVTEGSVNITQPYNVTQRDNHRSDTILVATMFLNPPMTQRIAGIIAISVFVGIALLTLLTLCLIKIGFFNREKIDLEALKAENDLCIKIV